MGYTKPMIHRCGAEASCWYNYSSSGEMKKLMRNTETRGSDHKDHTQPHHSRCSHFKGTEAEFGKMADWSEHGMYKWPSLYFKYYD